MNDPLQFQKLILLKYQTSHVARVCRNIADIHLVGVLRPSKTTLGYVEMSQVFLGDSQYWAVRIGCLAQEHKTIIELFAYCKGGTS